MTPGIPVVKALLAMLTVSPKMLNRGNFSPIIPATISPL